MNPEVGCSAGRQCSSPGSVLPAVEVEREVDVVLPPRPQHETLCAQHPLCDFVC